MFKSIRVLDFGPELIPRLPLCVLNTRNLELCAPLPCILITIGVSNRHVARKYDSSADKCTSPPAGRLLALELL